MLLEIPKNAFRREEHSSSQGSGRLVLEAIPIEILTKRTKLRSSLMKTMGDILEITAGLSGLNRVATY